MNDLQNRMHKLRDECMPTLKVMETVYVDLERRLFWPTCAPEQEWLRRILAGVLYGYVPSRKHEHKVETLEVYDVVYDFLLELEEKKMESVVTVDDFITCYQAYCTKRIMERIAEQGIAKPWTEKDGEIVENLLKLLDERRQKALYLYYHDGLKKKEVGEQLGISSTGADRLITTAIRYVLPRKARARGLTRLFGIVVNSRTQMSNEVLSEAMSSALFTHISEIEYLGTRLEYVLLNNNCEYIVDVLMNASSFLRKRPKNFGNDSLDQLKQIMHQIGERHKVIISLDRGMADFTDEQKEYIQSERRKK